MQLRRSRGRTDMVPKVAVVKSPKGSRLAPAHDDDRPSVGRESARSSFSLSDSGSTSKIVALEGEVKLLRAENRRLRADQVSSSQSLNGSGNLNGGTKAGENLAQALASATDRAKALEEEVEWEKDNAKT